ncbi:MAG: LysR family transcriptional regulator [Kofleriaceae bacterium]
MLNYNHLYYFHVTASEGTIARAAEKLGVGQPTVSEQIRQLERTLETALFERVGGKLRLTEAGRGAFEHTSVMFRAGERLLDTLSTVKSPPPLSLRVGISSAVSRSVATDFLLPLFALEECVPTLRGGECHEMLRDLRSHDLDLLLCESDPEASSRPGLEVIPIHRPRLVAVTSATQPPDDRWTDVALVHYRPSSVFRFHVDTYLEEKNIRPRIAAETDDAFVMMAAVMRGGFVAFVPWSVAREAVKANRVRVLAKLDPNNIAIHALYHATEKATVAQRAVEMLAAYARENEEVG